MVLTWDGATMTDALHCLALIVVANGAPVVAHKLFGRRFDNAVDAGLHLFDGQPVFGPAKTVRGILAALIATPLAALAVGAPLAVGGWIAFWSMLGDLLSSFLKRRLGLPPSTMAPGLDQIPESLLPLLAVRIRYAFGAYEITALVGAFIVIELLLSRLLYRLQLRKQPY